MLMLGQSIVANKFGQAAQTYNENADVQERAALFLAEGLKRVAPHVPPGPILEIGCGTGLFSRHLVEQFSQRKILLSDISPEMVRSCKAHIDSQNLKFAVLDAETSPHWGQQFALIASAFGAQWFKDLSTTFDGIYNSLLPGGCFIFSVPTNESFSEWKSLCSHSHLKYTGNNLPNEAKFRAFWSQRTKSFEIRTTRIQTRHASSIEFFRSLKGIGATTSTTRVFKTDSSTVEESAVLKQATNLRRIIKQWDESANGSITVTYEVMCGIVRREQ